MLNQADVMLANGNADWIGKVVKKENEKYRIEAFNGRATVRPFVLLNVKTGKTTRVSADWISEGTVLKSSTFQSPDVSTLKRGMRVWCVWPEDGEWYQGTIKAMREVQGSTRYKVEFDDGDTRNFAPKSEIKLVH